jgi:tetratricopeptide (TPR) repeat protein
MAPLVHSGLSSLLASLLAVGPNEGDGFATLAKEHQRRAIELFNAGEYQRAAIEIERAYELQPLPIYLYSWAQAERLAGNCDHASILYRRFLATGPPDDQAELARQQLHRCPPQESVDQAGGEPPPRGFEAGSRDAGDESQHPSTGPVTERSAPATSTPSVAPNPAEDRRLRGRIAAPVLLAVGALGTLTGSGLLIAAHTWPNRLASNSNLGDYRQQRDRAGAMNIAGATLVAVGGALLVGGIAAAIVSRQRAKRVAILPVGTGVHLAGTF